MINLITEKQKVQAIAPDAKITQELDDHGIYYTIVQRTELSTKQRLALSLLFSPRKVELKVTASKFKLSTSYN